MRWKASWLAVFLLLAPMAARLAAGVRDSGAARCALACARAGMGVENASCCPMGHGAALPTLSSCARDDAALPAAALLMLLVAALLLPLPSFARRLGLSPDAAMPFPLSRVPDKVPLLLG